MSLFLASAIALSGLRIVNPHEVRVDAVVRCGSVSSALQLEPHDAADLAGRDACAQPVILSAKPLLAFETFEEEGESQRIIAPLSNVLTNADCDPLPMAIPLFGCERGTATASVKPIDGATYLWSAEEATITSGQGTPRITVALGSSAAARLTAVVTAPGCSRTASGVIAVRKPLSLVELKAPASVDAGKSFTIEWTYAAGSEPVSQVLKGNAFPAPVVLTREQRSYTFKPGVAGSNTVELIASYAASIPVTTPKSGGRRRAAGSTYVTASNCAEVRASKQFVVHCDATASAIDAPADTESGAIVNARVALAPGETAKWSVENGRFLTVDEGESVQVVADDFVPRMYLEVSVARADSCVVRSTAEIAVRPRASCTTVPPTAAVALLSQSCALATVQASFTGTPPFRGAWSDGTTFETYQPSLTRDFNTFGTFTILGFRDATCDGVVTGSAVAKNPAPQAVITAEDSCTETKLTAHLTGTPPFRGRWMPGEWFETNDTTMTMTMPPGATWSQIIHLTDASCPTGEGSYSNELVLRWRPSLQVEAPSVVCVSEVPSFVTVTFGSDMPPYSVQWSDGVVSTSSSPQRFVYREVTTNKWSDTVGIVRAWDRDCDVTIASPVVNLSYRPKPRIDTFSNSDIVVCAGTPGKIVLENIAMHPDTMFTWSAVDAEILSGQGTREITFKATKPGWSGLITVQASFPDGGCDPVAYRQTVGVYVATPAAISDFVVTPSTIPAGGSAVISFRTTGDVEYFDLGTTDSARANDIQESQFQCANGKCTFPYRDTKGAGAVTLELVYGGRCNWTNPPMTTSLTITP